MRSRTLHTDGEQRTVAIVLSTGDEAMACLKAFAEREHVTAAQLTAIGAFASATLGYFDWTTKEYRRNAVDEQGTRRQALPWVLFVSIVAPHFPLAARPDHYVRYFDRDLPRPKL